MASVALFRSAPVLKKVSVVANPLGSSFKRSVHAITDSPTAIRARDIGVDVGRRPAIEHAGPLVGLHDGEATVRLPGVDNLVAVREVEECVEREPSIGERVAEPPVELGLAVPENGAVGPGDRAVAVQVGDLEFAGRAVQRILQVALVAHLPETRDLVAIDRAEGLAYPHEVHVARIEEVAGARRDRELGDGDRLPRDWVRSRPQVEDLVVIMGDGQRAPPGELWPLDVSGGDRQLHTVVLYRADVL